MTIPRRLEHLLIRETADAYHAQSGTYLSSHLLAMFRRCPQQYHWKRQGLIADEDRPAYLIGRALHTLVLEGRETYQSSFAVGGPINPKTNQPFGVATKAFCEWAEAQGKPVLTSEQASDIQQMAKAIASHDTAKKLLAHGTAEGVVRCDYQGRNSQIRLDFLGSCREPAIGIVDIKTCDDLTWFEADARRYGYAHQMAFYRAVLAQAAKGSPLDIPVHLIAVEKKAPFRCGVWRIAEDVLGIAQRENESAIEHLKHCEQNNHWPTGYEELRAFDWI